MKLKSIKKIKVYKSFQDFDWQPFLNNETFHDEVNILYGENGSGKSSIANLLKNVSENKDFGKYKPAEACLVFDDGEKKYPVNDEWDNKIAKDSILFFDREFVDKNVHLGHRRDTTQNGNKSGSAVAEQRRSKVANAVQEMLQVADRNGGIGQQVKTIAQAQTQNQEKLEASLQKVQSRSGFAKFFVGPNYGEINNTKKILEQNKEQIKQLNQVKNQLTNQGDAQNLTQQIQTLEQANLEIENSLGTAQKSFSLFGWMFRMFSN